MFFFGLNIVASMFSDGKLNVMNVGTFDAGFVRSFMRKSFLSTFRAIVAASPARNHIHNR
jgi:hypothetical protein